MLSGLQQLSPMPCHSTTGVGSDEKYYGDGDKNTITNTVMLIMMMVMLIYGDRERERATVIRALTWRELGLVGI